MTIRLSLARFSLLFFVILLIVFLGLTNVARAQEIMSLDEVKKGDKGYGLTVFEGNKAEKFDFEVVGIYESFPKYIVVYLSGGPKDRNGQEILKNANVIAGMSGSPLYVNNKVIGSIAMAPTFPKEPYALVTHIEFTLSFVTSTLTLPNKFISGNFQWPGFTEYIKPGESYTFCEVWGADFVCGGGTVIMSNPYDHKFLYLLGHSGYVRTGVIALPFWRSQVLAVLPSLASSTKIVQESELGPMLGSVIFNGPFGQIAQIGSMPKFMSVRVVLENSMPEKRDRTFFLAYTANTPMHIAGCFLAQRGLTDGLLDLDVDVKMNILGMGEVRWTSLVNLEYALKAGQLANLFMTDALDPVVDRMDIVMRARPKYRMLKLSEVTAKAKPVEVTKKPNLATGPLEFTLSISAIGDGNWNKTVEIKVDDKFKGKKLQIADGETLFNEILPSLGPNKDAVESLNKISKRTALYLYYKKDKEPADTKKKEGQENATAVALQNVSGGMNLAVPAAAGSEKSVGLPASASVDFAWVQKPAESDIEILYVMDLPSATHLVRGKKDFSVPTADVAKTKKKKTFGIF